MVNWPIVPLSLNTNVVGDACTPYPPGTPSLAGKIALVRRGDCDFVVKQQNLEALGAKYILIYNSGTAPLLIPYTNETTGSLIGLVATQLGESIVNTVKAGGTVTADFSVLPEIPIALSFDAGNRPNSFTSWGALEDLQIKPDIAGPGGDIFSTWLDGGYNIISGTSMACPYIAGVAALYIGANGGRQKHGKGFARDLARRIISSGVSLPWSDDTAHDFGFDAPPSQVGTGLVDAYKVVMYKTDLNFEKMALNDTRHFSHHHHVTVTNRDKRPVSYKFQLQPGAGVDTLGWVEPIIGLGLTKRIKTFDQLQPRSYVPEVSLPHDFTLWPGQSKEVTVGFKNPDSLGWNASGLPLYGGKIVVRGSNGEILSIPYTGVGADLRRELGSAVENPFPLCVSTPDNIGIEDKSKYTYHTCFNFPNFNPQGLDFFKHRPFYQY